MAEIKCKKNGHTVRFEVPPGENPVKYAKKKLKELSGKRPYLWKFETV